MHPNVARYPEIAALLANEIAYGLWRKQRVYDHVDITPPVPAPDGRVEHTISWHDEREMGRVVAVTVTRTELRELQAKINEVLNDTLEEGS